MRRHRCNVFESLVCLIVLFISCKIYQNLNKLKIVFTYLIFNYLSSKNPCVGEGLLERRPLFFILCSFHLGPATMSSIHLVIGFPLYRFPIGPFHHVTRLVHRSSFNLATWPAHFHFSFEQDLKRRR